MQRFGRLDVLVHCAAIGDSGADLAELTVEEIDQLLAVNVKGTLIMAQAAVTRLSVMKRGPVG